MKRGKELCLLILTLVILASCTSENKKASPASPNQTSEPGPEHKWSGGKFDPPITITTVRAIGSDYVFINGEDIHHNVHNKWAEEKLGIIIKDLWNTEDNSAYHTKLKLSLATNEGIPDVFIVQDPNLIADFIQSGYIKDIRTDFDRYAPERIKKLYQQYPGTMIQVMQQEKLMGLPILASGEGSNPVLWIRQDWLDRLQLKAPETIEQFEQVLDAFTNQDPDGNGVKNTYGFTFSSKNGVSNWMSDASFLFGAYAGKFIPGIWKKAEDHTLRYGSVQPEIKTALGKLREWYSKGYLTPDSAALDEIKATESFIRGEAGMIAAPYWAMQWPLNDIKLNQPGAEVKAYPLPKGQGGKSGRFTGTINEDKVMLFNKNFKHMDAFFYYMDKIYDREFETGDFKYGYFEGYDYAIVDSKPVYDLTQFPVTLKRRPTPGKYHLFWNSPQIPYREMVDLHHVYEGNPLSTFAQMRAATQEPEGIRAGAVNFQMRDMNAPNDFLGAPTPTMRRMGDSLIKMEQEAFVRIIYGNAPLSYFDTFVQSWENKGGKQMEAEVNEWYRSINIHNK